jgi:hypothetical protein
MTTSPRATGARLLFAPVIQHWKQRPDADMWRATQWRATQAAHEDATLCCAAAATSAPASYATSFLITLAGCVLYFWQYRPIFFSSALYAYSSYSTHCWLYRYLWATHPALHSYGRSSPPAEFAISSNGQTHVCQSLLLDKFLWCSLCQTDLCKSCPKSGKRPPSKMPQSEQVNIWVVLNRSNSGHRLDRIHQLLISLK